MTDHMFEWIVNGICITIVGALFVFYRWYVRSQDVFETETNNTLEILQKEYNENIKLLQQVKKEREEIKLEYQLLKQKMERSNEKQSKIYVLIMEEHKKNMKREMLHLEQKFKTNALHYLENFLIEKMSDEKKYCFYNQIDLKLLQS